LTRSLPKPNDRATAVSWATSLLTDPGTVFLDTETTGLGKWAEIVDIAIVAADGEVLLNQLVQPVRPIPVEAMFVHGISNDHVREAPSWGEIADRVRGLLDGRTVVAYNSSFDRIMIEQSCVAVALTPFAFQWQCAMRAYAAYRKDPALPSGGYRWRPLHEAADAFGIAVPTHRALADAETCRAVVMWMARG